MINHGHVIKDLHVARDYCSNVVNHFSNSVLSFVIIYYLKILDYGISYILRVYGAFFFCYVLHKLFDSDIS